MSKECEEVKVPRQCEKCRHRGCDLPKRIPVMTRGARCLDFESRDSSCRRQKNPPDWKADWYRQLGGRNTLLDDLTYKESDPKVKRDIGYTLNRVRELEAQGRTISRSLDERINSMHTMVKELKDRCEDRLGNHQELIGSHLNMIEGSRFLRQKLKQRVDAQDGRLGTIEKAIDAVSCALAKLQEQNLSTRLDAMEAVDPVRLASWVSDRLANLESNEARFQERIEELQRDVLALKDRDRIAKAKAVDFDNRLASMGKEAQAMRNNHRLRLETVEVKVANLESRHPLNTVHDHSLDGKKG